MPRSPRFLAVPPDLQTMFQAEAVKRDDYGFWLHSAFLGEEYVDRDVTTLPISEGIEFTFVDFESDAPAELQTQYDSQDWEGATRQWQPTKPAGDGWFLVG